MLGGDAIGSIFQNISAIYQLNTSYLAKLEARFKESDMPNVGDLLDIDKMQEQYTIYCNGYNLALTNFEGHKKATKGFGAFLHDASSDGDLRGLGLVDFISKPMQRITKYPLLFRELIKVTPMYDEDYERLTLTLKACESVLLTINGIQTSRCPLCALCARCGDF